MLKVSKMIGTKSNKLTQKFEYWIRNTFEKCRIGRIALLILMESRTDVRKE